MDQPAITPEAGTRAMGRSSQTEIIAFVVMVAARR